MKRFFALLLAGLLLASLAGAEGSLRGYSREEGYVYLQLGKYPQTAEGEELPILWRVLTADEEKAYLLSEYILFARPMHTTGRSFEEEAAKLKDRGKDEAKILQSVSKLKADYSRVDYRDELKGDFAKTELCAYLNGTFASDAFTEEELGMLEPCGEFGKVFLVTRDDMKNKEIGLGSVNPGSTNVKKILANPGVRAWGTEWAIKNNGVSPEEYPDPEARVYGLAGEHVTVQETRLYVFQARFGSCSPWWARNQSETDGRQAIATKDGGQIGRLEVARDNIGVRPAVYLALDAFETEGGSGTLEDPFVITPKAREAE